MMGVVPNFTVAREGYGWIVRKDGEKVFGRTVRAKAEEARDRFEREARTVTRDCLTCGGAFQSEGPHNRMCDKCRQGAGAVFEGAV